MPLSGLEIYKLLPKTNCRDCGFATCLAFAMQLAAKKAQIDKCPHVKDETKTTLAEASLPPIKLVSIGKDDFQLDVGNETVLFRHEEKFHRPAGLGVIFEDALSDEEFKKKKGSFLKLSFERIGQHLAFNIMAMKYSSKKDIFLNRLKEMISENKFAALLMVNDAAVLKEALEISAANRPLVYVEGLNNLKSIAELCANYKVPLAISSDSLERLAQAAKDITSAGVQEIVLGLDGLSPRLKLFNATQIRRLALKKKFRQLGYPTITFIDTGNEYQDVLEASTCIAKYSSLVILKNVSEWQALTLLTLRQSIYTDPQKPLQVEPKIYSIGATNENSPLAVTTNFSLSYYTVLSEVEASKIPVFLMSVDTEGQSVLTAWASEKFTADKITESLKKFEADQQAPHKSIIIPGYVAVMSGDLEDKSGWKVAVGPREAAGIPQFLKNYKVG